MTTLDGARESRVHTPPTRRAMLAGAVALPAAVVLPAASATPSPLERDLDALVRWTARSEASGKDMEDDEHARWCAAQDAVLGRAEALSATAENARIKAKAVLQCACCHLDEFNERQTTGERLLGQILAGLVGHDFLSSLPLDVFAPYPAEHPPPAQRPHSDARLRQLGDKLKARLARWEHLDREFDRLSEADPHGPAVEACSAEAREVADAIRRVCRSIGEIAPSTMAGLQVRAAANAVYLDFTTDAEPDVLAAATDLAAQVKKMAGGKSG